MTDITAELVRKYFIYDYETGLLKWQFNQRTDVVGNVFGSICRDGYVRSKFFKKRVLIHRMIWLYVTGDWPTYTIDHIDGNKSNNRFSNLRDVSVYKNMQNLRKSSKKSSTGLLGVCHYKRTNKYIATITYDGKRIHLGYFTTPNLAHEAYLTAKRRLHSTCTI